MNSFGTKLRVSIFGESHGEMIGVVLDGVPAGMPLAEGDFLPDLARRRSGARGTTTRHEQDTPRIVAGLHDGHTTGAPLAIVFTNSDTRSGDYASLVDHPRPSHADFVAGRKFGGMNDPRGGGHFSGRLTLTLVAAGVVARRMLEGIEITSRIMSIGGCSDQAEFERIVEAAMAEGDSVGGVIECCAAGVPVGLGEPFFDSVESLASHLLFSIPAVRGVEFGNGFAAAALRGSQNNDLILDPSGRTATNNAGGVVGGITNGNPLVVRVAVKPTPSISRPQQTLNLQSGKPEPLVIRGRHDACIALRAPVVVESALAIALAQLIPTDGKI
ncbi:chorismate synthase [Bacteroidia bacterium]|nr:chorismate synthase [Bacteroidia bacterium]